MGRKHALLLFPLLLSAACLQPACALSLRLLPGRLFKHIQKVEHIDTTLAGPHSPPHPSYSPRSSPNPLPPAAEPQAATARPALRRLALHPLRPPPVQARHPPSRDPPARTLSLNPFQRWCPRNEGNYLPPPTKPPLPVKVPPPPGLKCGPTLARRHPPRAAQKCRRGHGATCFRGQGQGQVRRDRETLIYQRPPLAGGIRRHSQYSAGGTGGPGECRPSGKKGYKLPAQTLQIFRRGGALQYYVQNGVEV
jgi:hypothetical protein